MPLELAQVVVTAGGKDWWGRTSRFILGSRWTHVWIVTGPDELVESFFPIGVRKYSIAMRMKELKAAGRAYVVMDHPGINAVERENIAEKAKSFVGKKYNIFTLFFWVLFGRFCNLTRRKLVCSTLITASYKEGAGRDLFKLKNCHFLYKGQQADLKRGMATPPEIFLYSDLLIRRRNSN